MIQEILVTFDVEYLWFQGPPGKDGLPGHPGQRGETVSDPTLLINIFYLWHLIISQKDTLLLTSQIAG